MNLIPSLRPDTQGKLIQQMSGLQSGGSSLPRSYHNMEHLQQMFGVLDLFGHNVEDFLSMHLAVWFHDLHYDCRAPKGENEDRSCELVTRWFSSRPDLARLAEKDNHLVERIQLYIQRTKTHELTADDASDSNHVLNPRCLMHFLWADLHVLSADAPDYWQYLVKLRTEYACFDDAQWRRGRINFLESMLARPSILAIRPGEDLPSEETWARRNLNFELQQLRENKSYLQWQF
mgnify:CR=1 FL=1